VELIRVRVESLAVQGPSAAELRAARKALIAGHLAARDSLVRSATGLALHEAYGLGHRQFVDYPRALRKVSLSQVREAAKAYLSWNLAVIDTVTNMPLSPGAERRARGARRRARKRRR
jgi:predicted Zn-dependent peptidase